MGQRISWVFINPSSTAIKAFHMPNSKRRRPTTTVVLTARGTRLIPSLTSEIKRQYENQHHKMLGLWYPNGSGTELTFSYEGTRGRGPDQHAITRRLRDIVIPLLPEDVDYDLHYWNDPRRKK